MIPGPRVPALFQSVHYFARPLGFSEHWSRRYGDRFRARIFGFGESIFLSDPKDHRAVFTADSDTLHAGEANQILKRLLGEHSLLTLDGDAHLRQRKLLLPPFHGERMRAYADVIREVTLSRIEGWPIGTAFPIHREMQGITLEVILRTVFGVTDRDRLREMESLLLTLFRTVASPFSLIAGSSLAFARVWGRARAAKQAADRALYREIQLRRSAPDLEARSDILSMLLLARDEDGGAMTDEELRDELMTLLAAGHETSATGLAWAFARVLRDARIECCLREEIDRADFEHLLYTDAVIKEVLRLHPVILEVGRRVKKPFRLGDEDIPVGMFLVPSIFLTHRRPDLYPDPEVFRPERFLDTKIDPYAWMPFGGGVRRCLGIAFALYEMKIILATVLGAMRLELADFRIPRSVWHSITIAPDGGVPIRVKGQRPSRRSTQVVPQMPSAPLF